MALIRIITYLQEIKIQLPVNAFGIEASAPTGLRRLPPLGWPTVIHIQAGWRDREHKTN
jgi:hypothetical protein